MKISHYQTIIYFFVLIILIVYLGLSIFAIFSFPSNITQAKFDKNVDISGSLTAESVTAENGDFSSLISNNLTTNDINPRAFNDLLNINLSGTTAIGNLQITGTFNPENISTGTINAIDDVTSNNGVNSLNDLAQVTTSNALAITTINGEITQINSNAVTTNGNVSANTASISTINGEITQINSNAVITNGNVSANTASINTINTSISTINTSLTDKLSLTGGTLIGGLTGTTLGLSGNMTANKITAAAQLGIAILTQTQILALTENQLGDIVFNSTTSTPMYYNGTAYQAFSSGGSFDPTITGPLAGDLLYYNGSVWKNGFYMSPPTLTFTSPFSVDFSNFVTPFYWNSTSANMKIYLRIYYDPDLTDVIVDTNLVGNSWTGNSGVLQYNNTYYAVGQYENTLYPNSLSAISQTLTFTTPDSDIIAQQLTTSLAAYDAAPTNTAVNITQTEYNNIVANVPDNVPSGNTNPFVNGSTAPLSDQAVTSNVLTSFPANSYLVAYSYMSYGLGSSSGYFALANNQVISSSSPVYPWVTSSGEVANGIYYYCIKAPPTPLSQSAAVAPIVLSNSTIPFVVGNVIELRFYNSPLPVYTPGQTVVLNQTNNAAGLLNVSFVSTPTKGW